MQVNGADGVFQGGGVKGIALVGALLGFAERGWTRWVNVAGAGTGAIVAAYLACGHDAYDTEQLFRSAPYSRFEDFGPGGRLETTSGAGSTTSSPDAPLPRSRRTAARASS